jgi:hypothetical protein
LWRSFSAAAKLFIPWAILPPLLLFVASVASSVNIFALRYALAAACGLALFVACLIRSIGPARARRVVVQAIVVLSLANTFSTSHNNEDWRSAAHAIRAHNANVSMPVLARAGFLSHTAEVLRDEDSRPSVLAPFKRRDGQASRRRRLPGSWPRLNLPVVAPLLGSVLREKDFGIAFDRGGAGWSSDFAAHLTFAKAFWKGEAGYDVQSHLRVTGERFGQLVEHALPFGYSPTMLWVLGPLCLASPAWAFILWTLLGVAAVWWMTRPQWAPWIAAAVFSPAAIACFTGGQTSFLTAAGLLFLMLRDLDRDAASTKASSLRSAWPDAIVLWALTAKPPLALTAGVALVAERRWRTVALALGLSVLTSAALMPLLGTAWGHDYVHLMTHYDLESADPAFVWSLKPQTMGNLRALLHVTVGLGDGLASRCSSGVWGLSILGVVAIGWQRRLAPEAVWGFAVLAYLLFCPHVTATEELHLVVVLALIAHASRIVPGAVRWPAVALVLAVLYLAPGFGYQGALGIPSAFLAKALLVGLVLGVGRHARSVKLSRLGGQLGT